MSTDNSLTPYDTGERLEPQVWPLLDQEAPIEPDRYGRVDFDDDYGQTVATAFGRRKGEHYELVVEAHDDDLVVTEIRDEAAPGRKILRWEIDVEDDDPRTTALHVWREIFGQGDPGPDDSCIFTAVDTATGEETTFDLSEEP